MKTNIPPDESPVKGQAKNDATRPNWTPVEQKAIDDFAALVWSMRCRDLAGGREARRRLRILGFSVVPIGVKAVAQ